MFTDKHPPVWKVSQAKARLSEIMRLAENGEPQIIGIRKPCVLVSLDNSFSGYKEHAQAKEAEEKVHLGRWLLESAPRVHWEPPAREKFERPPPFADKNAGGI